MQIAIMADSHDNLANLKKTLSYLNSLGIKKIIHCGDLCHTQILNFIHQEFKGQLYLSLGNGDNLKDFGKEKTETKIFPNFGFFTIGKKKNKQKIAFCHYKKRAKELAKTSKYNLIFYGHSHKPWVEKIDKTLLINPGNLCGVFYKPSFAVYDTEKQGLSLIRLDLI